jgi:hypothetical protein
MNEDGVLIGIWDYFFPKMDFRIPLMSQRFLNPGSVLSPI